MKLNKIILIFILLVLTGCKPKSTQIDITHCVEEFVFDYEEEVIASTITQINDQLFKVELFGDTQYAIYLLNITNNEIYNYTNGSC